MIVQRLLLGIAGMILALAVPLCAASEDYVADWSAQRESAFKEVWTTVNDAYFDPKFGGVDWKQVGETYRQRLHEAKDLKDLRKLLQTMLHELGRSHFSILPREMAVFSAIERSRVGDAGLTVASIHGEVAVITVRKNSSAWQAGLRPGVVIEEINGVKLVALQAALEKIGMDDVRRNNQLAYFVEAGLAVSVGKDLNLVVKSVNDETKTAAFVAEAHSGTWSEPMGNFPSMPVACEVRRNAEGLAYVHLTAFVPVIMKELKTFLRSLKPGDGLIIDLRGNHGGLSAMAPGISGWLFSEEVSLGRMRLRQGETNFMVYPQSGAFLGPVAVLIDGGSASTSEILAAGLKDLGRARVFGVHSAGAALPSAFKTLATGDLFQYAIADILTPRGASLEGIGVSPDEEIDTTREELAAGHDPVLIAAESWLIGQRKPSGKTDVSESTATP